MQMNGVRLKHEDLAFIEKLYRSGKLDQAEAMLNRAEPTPVSLDAMRKIASARAWNARRIGDWGGVIRILEGYNLLASTWRNYCVTLADEEPPQHTAKDQRLLDEAMSKLGR